PGERRPAHPGAARKLLQRPAVLGAQLDEAPGQAGVDSAAAPARSVVSHVREYIPDMGNGGTGGECDLERGAPGAAGCATGRRGGPAAGRRTSSPIHRPVEVRSPVRLRRRGPGDGGRCRGRGSTARRRGTPGAGGAGPAPRTAGPAASPVPRHTATRGGG